MGTAIADDPAQAVVGGDAALAVGGPGQRHLGRFAGHEIHDLDGIADGVNVGIAGLQILVDADAAAGPDLQSGVHRQLVLRPHADAQDDQLCHQSFARFQAYGQSVGRGLKRGGRLTQYQFHSRGRQAFGDRSGHLPIERRQHLVLQLDEGRGNAAANEVFDHFQADESGPHHHGLPHALVQACLDLVGILEIPQGEDSRQIDAGNGRPQRRRSRGQNQLVVGFLVLAAGGQIANAHRLRRAVDGLDFGASPHVEVEAGPHTFRRNQQQFGPLGDLAAEVVGQAAVGKRDVAAAFDEHDWASSDKRRARAAAEAPPATPPMMSNFIVRILPTRSLMDATGTRRFAALVPRHAGQEQAHAAGVGHSGKDQPGPYEGR